MRQICWFMALGLLPMTFSKHYYSNHHDLDDEEEEPLDENDEKHMVDGRPLFREDYSKFMRPEDEEEYVEPISSEQLRQLHRKCDKDEDGIISFEEVHAYARNMRTLIAQRNAPEILDDVDENGDGKLSLDEILEDMQLDENLKDDDEMDEDEHQKEREKEPWRTINTAAFMAADADGDGLIDTDEVHGLYFPETHDDVLHAIAEIMLPLKDYNKDGVLQPKEFSDIADPSLEEAYQNCLNKRRDEQHPIKCFDNELDEEEEHAFSKLDKDNSGTLDVEELKAWVTGKYGGYYTEQSLKQMFLHADVDHDLHLTMDELDEFRHELTEHDAHEHLKDWIAHDEWEDPHGEL